LGRQGWAAHHHASPFARVNHGGRLRVGPEARTRSRGRPVAGQVTRSEPDWRRSARHRGCVRTRLLAGSSLRAEASRRLRLLIRASRRSARGRPAQRWRASGCRQGRGGSSRCRRWLAVGFGSEPGPIQSLIVPKTCSTRLRRSRMASGHSSSRCCMASMTSSCSQRVMRRCWLGVHLALIAQVPQLLDQ